MYFYECLGRVKTKRKINNGLLFDLLIIWREFIDNGINVKLNYGNFEKDSLDGYVTKVG